MKLITLSLLPIAIFASSVITTIQFKPKRDAINNKINTTTQNEKKKILGDKIEIIELKQLNFTENLIKLIKSKDK